MSLSVEKQLLPLAAMAQSINQVCCVAKTGLLSTDTLDASLRCIFVQSPDSISDIYRGTQDIRPGLQLTSEILHRFDALEHGPLVRYTLAVMALERRLAQRPDLLTRLGDGIEIVGKDLSASEPLREDVVMALGDLYGDVVGSLGQRIQIVGARQHLSNTVNIARIRALLLSALRSSVLWHQLGGRRWHLLLRRHKFRNALKIYQ